MTDFDHNGNKIKDQDFILVDFSRFKDNWENTSNGSSDESPNDNGQSVRVDWSEFAHSLPRQESSVEPTPPLDLRKEKRIQDVIENMDIVDEAKERRTQRDKPEFEEPDVYDLASFLEIPDNPTKYKVDQLWPIGGNVLFAAPAKFGKSTVMMNLLRVLLDGGNFLGHFHAPRIADDEKILLLDLEMSVDRVRSELRAQAITNAGTQLMVAPLRGKAKDFDITNPETRAFWVKRCLDNNVKTFILDPLAPILGCLAIDENDNSMVNRFFQQLDEFKVEAGIRDMMVVHHCGHSADWRPRGASRFNDWPDALWLAKLEGDLDDNPDRKFFARGRDVGEDFKGAGLIVREDADKPKILTFKEGNATNRTADAALGTLENWINIVPRDFPSTCAEGATRAKLIELGTSKVGWNDQVLDLSIKKVDEYLNTLVTQNRAHACTWKTKGNPLRFVASLSDCRNPNCPQGGTGQIAQ